MTIKPNHDQSQQILFTEHSDFSREQTRKQKEHALEELKNAEYFYLVVCNKQEKDGKLGFQTRGMSCVDYLAFPSMYESCKRWLDRTFETMAKKLAEQCTPKKADITKVLKEFLFASEQLSENEEKEEDGYGYKD